MANQDAINLGLKAKELRESSIFQTIIAEVNKDIFEVWASDKDSKNTAGREGIYFRSRGIQSLIEKIDAMVMNGEMEMKILERDEELRRKQVVKLEEEVPE